MGPGSSVAETTQARTFASEKDRQRDMRRRKIADAKQRAWTFGHKVFWRTMHLTGLARPYSKTMCRLNLYNKFPDGRCQWCGDNHSEIAGQGDAK